MDRPGWIKPDGLSAEMVHVTCEKHFQEVKRATALQGMPLKKSREGALELRYDALKHSPLNKSTAIYNRRLIPPNCVQMPEWTGEGEINPNDVWQNKIYGVHRRSGGDAVFHDHGNLNFSSFEMDSIDCR
jgi:hypothetical protein